MKKPALDQLWSCLTRCLLFDEPGSKWNKLLVQAAKHLKNASNDLDSEPLPRQQAVFTRVFGCSDSQEQTLSRIFNLVLALEDIRRFEDSCFFNWYLSSMADAEPSPGPNRLIEGLASRFNLSQGETIWLSHAISAVPRWTALLEEGPWQGDPLAEFVRECLANIKCSEEPVSAVARAQQLFRTLLDQRRAGLPQGFQPYLLLLVEGPTEAIMLPRFAELTGHDISSVLIIPCGGAKQVLRKYIALADITRLPVWCLMDSDAIEQSAAVTELLRANKDALHMWQQGEIEDSLRTDVVLRYLNMFVSEHGLSSTLKPDDLDVDRRRTAALDRIWRGFGLGDFDKVGFARYLADRLQPSEIPAQVARLLEAMAAKARASE